MQAEISNITALIGNPIRTHILWVLLDGRAYTATELAICTETSASNISMHLSKLILADLLTVESQGRHKYYRFSRPEVVYAIEALANLLPEKKARKIKSTNTSIEYCRSCYDHLAGKIGVLITEKLCALEIIKLEDKEYTVTEKGDAFFNDLGIKTDELRKQRRFFATPCLDWSERKHHLAGSLGAAFLSTALQLDWLRKVNNSRAIIVTSKGQLELYDRLKVTT